MPNRKEVPKHRFSKEFKKSELSVQRNQLLAIKWREICDMYVTCTAREDIMVEASGSRGSHKKEKPASVMDCNKYKIGINISHHMLSYHSF